MPLSRFGWLPPLFLLLLLHVTFFTLTTAFQDVISISAPNENYFSRQKRSLNEPTEVSSLASSVHLNTSHLSLILSWTGVNSRYLLCISKSKTASSVYLSQDYGTTFQDISQRFLLPDGNASVLFSFKPHAHEHCTFVFTDVAHKTLFMTKDCGLNVEAQPLSFSPNVIEFDQRSRNTFLVHDTQDPERKLYVTNDFGQEFIHVQDYVQKFLLVYDAPQTHLFLQRATPGGLSNILSSKSFFLNSSDVDVVYSGVLDYEIRGSFIFVKTRDEAHSGYKELFVSQIGKDGTPGRFVRAEFGDDRPIHDYYIVDVTIDNQVLLCANFDSQLSNLYTSLRLNDYEATFSLSLPRVIFYNPSTTWNSSWLRYTSEESPFVDIVKVQGLRGVYIANQIRASYFDSKRSDIVPEDLKSLITFDLGALWSPIRKPRLDKGIRLPLNCSKKGNCSLHLSQYLSNKYPSARSIPILSRASSVGLILGSGNIGNHLGVGKSNVYLSADAGLSWQQTLAGSYYYSIGDHGGIIVAVKYYKTDGPTNELLYSINEGVTWNPLVFYKKPVRIFGLLTPPGENSTIFTMFGTEEINSVKWIIIKVDLKSVYLRNCTADDYKLWSPSDSSHGKHRNCLLGRKEVFERRVVHTNCYNGLKYDRLVKVENCHCERSDFQCDFGFIPDEASPRTCIANPQFTHMDLYEHPSTCKPGGTYRRKTGYVKIPGNTCIGGKEKEFSSLNVSCPLPSQEEFLIVNERVKVSRINLWNMSEVQVLPLKNISDVTTLEYDLDHDCAIWSDGKKKQICIQCMNETASGPRILISEYIESVQGMALDWSSRNLYFVDGKQRKIEVVRLDNGSIRRVILDDKVLKKPRGIAVYPGHGYLYYSDWYEGGPSIGRTLLDGKGHKTLIKGNNIVWPNYLSIDFIANRIYWTDSKIGHIGSCDLHGENLKFIDSAPNMEKKHPFSVAVHKEKMFWDDWIFKSVFVADKNSGKGKREIYSKMIAAMDVKIFSKSIRSQSSGCSTNPCSHLCIPLPETSPQGFKCLCPDGMKEVFLDSSSGKTCVFKSHNGTGILCGGGSFQCSSGDCVPAKSQCNGIKDCPDGSDEMNCDDCPSHFFKCADGKCINSHWRCDGESDCDDNSDEMKCGFKECAQGFFKCDNDQCVNAKYRCDLVEDCSDGSDEKNCTASEQKCSGNEFKCPESSKCFPQSWLCDGEPDCEDGSDEMNCRKYECTEWQFKCRDNTCIFKNWKCDGEFDCSDKSDEENCNSSIPSTRFPPFKHGECHGDKFKCSDGMCIPMSWKCDGVYDCKDKTDERNCGSSLRPTTSIPETTKTQKVLNMFECKSGKMIWQSWVCNGRDDCLDRGDEDPSLCKETQHCGDDDFRCEFSGECIKQDKICDKSVDCADESDEKGCGHDHVIIGPVVTYPCDPLLFACDDNQKCLADGLVCNGAKDCQDGSDEVNCHQSALHQIRGLLVDEDLISSESLTIHWWIADISSTRHILFQPKYRISGFDHLEWNKLPWLSIHNASFTFNELHPFTQYDLTVDLKLEDKVYESSHFITHRTYSSTPSPPLQLNALQIGRRVILNWKPPSRPNGLIKSYTLFISFFSDPLIKIRIGENVLKYEPNFEFSPGTNYTFTVSAENGITSGNISSETSLVFDEEAYKYSIRNLEVLDIRPHSVVLRWAAMGSISQFQIELRSPKNPFASYKNILVDGRSFNYTLRDLAPAEPYVAKIIPLKNHLHGTSLESRFITPGTPIPVPEITTVEANEKNVIEVSWRVKQGSHEALTWTYALYYGSSEQSLLEAGIRNSTSQSSIKLDNLNACESYIFRVGITEPFGNGRVSSGQTFNTPYSVLSPPKDLSSHNDEDGSVILSWSPPCLSDLKKENLGYLLSLHDLVTGSKKSIHITRTNYIHNEYKVRGVKRGGTYEASVRTDVKGSSSSPPLGFSGPPFPAPQEFTGRTERDTGNQFIYWYPGISQEDLGDSFSYELLLSQEEGFHKNVSTVFHVSQPPYVLAQDLLKPGVVYYLSVMAVSSKGYSSERSPLITLERPPSSSQEAVVVVSKTGAILVMIPIAVLLLAVVFYVHRHRKLKSRFKQFVSRYSSKSGATILSQNILDDEEEEEGFEAPIIRGFSDSEPLVIS